MSIFYHIFVSIFRSTPTPYSLHLFFPAPSIATSRNAHSHQPYHSYPTSRIWHFTPPPPHHLASLRIHFLHNVTHLNLLLEITRLFTPQGAYLIGKKGGFVHKCGSKVGLNADVFDVRKVSTESARLRRSRLEFSSFLRDLHRSSIRSKLRRFCS